MCGIFISVHSFRLWIFFSYPSNGSLVPSLTTFVCWKESHFSLFFFPSPPSYFSLWSCLKVSSVNTKGVWVKKNCQHSKRTQLVTIVDIDAWLIVGVASIIAFYLEQKWYIVCVCVYRYSIDSPTVMVQFDFHCNNLCVFHQFDRKMIAFDIVKTIVRVLRLLSSLPIQFVNWIWFVSICFIHKYIRQSSLNVLSFPLCRILAFISAYVESSTNELNLCAK